MPKGMWLSATRLDGRSNWIRSVLPFVTDRVAQTWFSVSFAYELTDPEEPKNLNGLDASELRKDSFRILEAMVNSEADVQSACLEEDDDEMLTEEHVDPELAVLLYNAMVDEDTISPSVRDSFLRILVQDALRLSKEAPDLFDAVLLPIADELAKHPPHPETHAESYRNVCQLVTEIWTSYLRDVIQARPSPPNLVMRTSEINKCSCGDCRLVKSYLEDQTPSTRYVFRGSEKRRRHLEKELLNSHGRAISCKTEKTGNPHALVINKQADLQHTEARQAWDRKASKLMRQLRELPLLFRARILGPSFFTALPGDSMEKILGDLAPSPAAIEPAAQAPEPTDTSLKPISGNAKSTATAKRKADDDLVDPTERKRPVRPGGRV